MPLGYRHGENNGSLLWLETERVFAITPVPVLCIFADELDLNPDKAIRRLIAALRNMRT